MNILQFKGSSPKEFLFVMAFALPCCAIVLCYARIFYIVRKAAAFKTNDVQLETTNTPKLVHIPKLEIKEDNNSSPENSHGKEDNIDVISSNNFPVGKGEPRAAKYLAKRDDDHQLKFIDSSVDSDLPPTLSQLQRKNVQISIDVPNPSSSAISLRTESTDVTQMVKL